VRAAVQVAYPVEPLHGQGQAGEQPDHEQTLALVVTDVLEAVAVLGAAEAIDDEILRPLDKGYTYADSLRVASALHVVRQPAMPLLQALTPGSAGFQPA